MALDFVSLLLSGDTPVQASISMSQLLQSSIPAGSLGAEKIEVPRTSVAEQQYQETTTRGLKKRAFASASDLLSKTASMLKKEADLEERYWGDIISVKKEGWRIVRSTFDKRILGVQFGFAEASPAYRERGIAALRRGTDGVVVLDHGQRYTENKVVRFRLFDGEEGIGISKQPYPETKSDAVHNAILDARNGIFEEELFQELSREARGLAAFNVETKSQSISIPFGKGKKIVIDLVGLSNYNEDAGIIQYSEVVEAISTATRALLCHGHRSNLRRRSMIPLPISEKPVPQIIYPILRPIMTYCLHDAELSQISAALSTLSSLSRAVGLGGSYKTECFKNILGNDLDNKSVGSIMDVLLRGLVSDATIDFGNNIKIGITLRTILLQPLYGSEYAVQIENEAASLKLPQNTRFKTANDCLEFLHHVLERALIRSIEGEENRDTSDSMVPKAVDLNSSPASFNEVTRKFGDMDYYVRVQASSGTLKLLHGWRSDRLKVQVWTATDKDGKKPIVEFLKEAVGSSQ
jgi:mediator of RNA polymerase II transcription subunit 17